MGDADRFMYAVREENRALANRVLELEDLVRRLVSDDHSLHQRAPEHEVVLEAILNQLGAHEIFAFEEIQALVDEASEPVDPYHYGPEGEFESVGEEGQTRA